jgi:hypothetical protein
MMTSSRMSRYALVLFVLFVLWALSSLVSYRRTGHPPLLTTQSLESAIDSTLSRLFTSNFSGLDHPTNLILFPQPDPVDDLCARLAGKRLLVVGPESSYYLYSLWIRAFGSRARPLHACDVGPDSCDLHHVCVSTAIQTHPRTKNAFSDHDLLDSKSSLLRYIPSTTLFFSSDQSHVTYKHPQIDPRTGVRVKNLFWEARARTADILVFHRGPTPAPASTYTGHNWSFVQELYMNSSTLYLRWEAHDVHAQNYSTAVQIFNAAVHETLDLFIPGVQRALLEITSSADVQTYGKILLWHAPWYVRPACTSSDTDTRVLSDLRDILSYPEDPWALYYNAQGSFFALHRSIGALTHTILQFTYITAYCRLFWPNSM